MIEPELLLPLPLIVAGTIFTAGQVASGHLRGESAWWRRALRLLLDIGLVAMLVSSERLLWTTLWVGAPASLVVAYHAWACRAHRLA